jgi:hypothetical protein
MFPREPQIFYKHVAHWFGSKRVDVDGIGPNQQTGKHRENLLPSFKSLFKICIWLLVMLADWHWMSNLKILFDKVQWGTPYILLLSGPNQR